MAKANPFFDVDFSKILSDFKVPGVDVEAVLATQRKNIEALTAANQLAFEGVQALVRRQSEILRQSLEQASHLLQEVLAAGTPEEKVAKQAELLKAAFERALVNAKELTELMTKSNHEASEVISKRVSESLEELKEQFVKNKK